MSCMSAIKGLEAAEVTDKTKPVACKDPVT